MKTLVGVLLLCAGSAKAYAAPAPISSDARFFPHVANSLSRENLEAYAAEFSEDTTIHHDGKIITKAEWVSILGRRFANRDHFKLVGFLIGADGLSVIEKISHTCRPDESCEGVPIFEVYQYKFSHGKIIDMVALAPATYVSGNLDVEVTMDN